MRVMDGVMAIPAILIAIALVAMWRGSLLTVVVAGAELFTGNALIVMAWVDRRIGTSALLRNLAEYGRAG